MYRVKKISCKNPEPLNENNFTKSSIVKKKKNHYFSISSCYFHFHNYNRQICHKPTLPITKKNLNRPSYFLIFFAIFVSINYQLIINTAKQTISSISSKNRLSPPWISFHTISISIIYSDQSIDKFIINTNIQSFIHDRVRKRRESFRFTIFVITNRDDEKHFNYITYIGETTG